MPTHILVVDDEEQLLLALQASLQGLGDEYEIGIARNGREALEKAKETPYDLVITDLRMPGLDGVQFTRALRVVSPETQVVWMTAYGEPEVESEANQLAVFRYLEKPLRISEIRQIAREALEAVNRQRAQPRASLWPAELLTKHLIQLYRDAGARCVLLITTGGHIIDMAGDIAGLDLDSLAVLLASNFLAAQEISRLLGRQSTFRVSYHESDEHNVYAYSVGEGYLLVVVFGQETKTGVIWFYGRRTADALKEILATAVQEEGIDDVLAAVLEQSVMQDLDWLTGEPVEPGPAPEGGAPAVEDPRPSGEAPSREEGEEGADAAQALSLQEARRRGLISEELYRRMAEGRRRQ